MLTHMHTHTHTTRKIKRKCTLWTINQFFLVCNDQIERGGVRPVVGFLATWDARRPRFLMTLDLSLGHFRTGATELHQPVVHVDLWIIFIFIFIFIWCSQVQFGSSWRILFLKRGHHDFDAQEMLAWMFWVPAARFVGCKEHWRGSHWGNVTWTTYRDRPPAISWGKVTQSYESAYLYLLMIYRRSLVHFEKFHCGERGLVQDVACVMATCECLWVNHDQWEPTHCMPLWRLNEVVFQNRRKPWMIKVCLFPPRQVGKSMTQGSFFFSAHLCDNSILVS